MSSNKPIPYIQKYQSPLSLAKVVRNPSAFLLQLSVEAGDIGQFSKGPIRIVCVNHPALIQSILVENAENLEKMPGVKVLREFTGDGLLINDGPTWTKHRKLAAPAFHSQRVAQYHHYMVTATDQLHATWCDSQQINIGDELKHLTLNIIGKTLFTYDLETLASGLAKDIHLALDYINYLAGVSAFAFMRFFIPQRKAAQEALQRIDKVVYDLIKVRRQLAVIRRPPDLLSLLIESRTETGEELSDGEIRDEIITMFVAGHETTATVLTWAFILIAQHPGIQDRLYAETSKIASTTMNSMEQLSQLPYAMQVLKESMRLYPGGFTIGRKAKTDIDVGGYRIPQNAWIMISPFTVHRNPNVFPDPYRFDPERFACNKEKEFPKGAYIPFGLGSRICIGNNLALLEGHTIIASLTRQFHFTNVSKGTIEVKPMVTLNPDRPVIMQITKRVIQDDTISKGER